MSRISDWCDEAAFTDWEHASGELPDWQDGYARIIAEGQPETLTSATAAHTIRDFPAPRSACIEVIGWRC